MENGLNPCPAVVVEQVLTTRKWSIKMQVICLTLIPQRKIARFSPFSGPFQFICCISAFLSFILITGNETLATLDPTYDHIPSI